jgi:hypothetical protein
MSAKLFGKKIDQRRPLFGKVFLEPTYNLEMNEGKLMSALERGRKPQNHENDIRQAPGTELWLPSRYKVTHQGCPKPHNIRRQRFKIDGTPCVTAVARLLGWLGKS